MTEVAGEVCDGFLCHGFTTREVPTTRSPIPALTHRPSEGRQDHEGVRDRRPLPSSSGSDDAQLPEGGRHTAPADRVLRVDTGVPRGARHPRVGRPPGGAERAVEAGRMAADGHPDRRRDPATRSPWSANPSRSRRSSAAATADVISRISFYTPYQSDPERSRAVINAVKALYQHHRPRRPRPWALRAARVAAARDGQLTHDRQAEPRAARHRPLAPQNRSNAAARSATRDRGPASTTCNSHPSSRSTTDRPAASCRAGRRGRCRPGCR